MTDIAKKTVLITGGAGGIGRLLAEWCIERHAARIILWDVNPEALERTCTALSESGGEVVGDDVDLADSSQIVAAAQRCLESGGVDILVNNAGVVTGKPLAEQTAEEIEYTIRINVLGVMHTTRAFLPAMIGRGTGHIVNMASASALLPVPKLTTYGASKWACMGFSESLRVELQEHPGIHVSTICPSYIKTGMFAGATGPLMAPLLEPAYAVNRILRAIERNQRLVRMPWIVNLAPVLYHALPAPVFDLFCGRLMGLYRSMDQFTGRKP